MSLLTYEVAYHLIDNPNKTYVISLLTSDITNSVENYLIKKHGKDKVVLHYYQPEKEEIDTQEVCSYCKCTRTVYKEQPREWNQAMLDKSLWRLL